MAGGLGATYFFSSFFSFIGELGLAALPEEGELVVPDAGLLGLLGVLELDDEDDGVPGAEDFAGSFLPQAARANAATTAQIKLVLMTILLKVGGKNAAASRRRGRILQTDCCARYRGI